MGGPRVSKDAEMLLVGIWMESVDKGEEMTAKEVLNVARERIGTTGSRYQILPRLRKIQLILREARHNLEETAKGGKVLTSPKKEEDTLWSEEDPWCLGSLKYCEISPDAVPAVLKVWKLCLATDSCFTIREAKWVARLQTAIKGMLNLRHWAYLYATRERVCELLKQPFDTSDLDAYLAMGSWELLTARWVSKAKSVQAGPAPNPALREPLSLTRSESDYVVALAESLSRAQIYASKEGLGKRTLELLDKPLESPQVSVEAQFVYAYWLLHLHNGPNWQNLTIKEQWSIFKKLRMWVQRHPWASMENPPDWVAIADTFPAHLIRQHPPLAPEKLLEKVGYPPQHLPKESFGEYREPKEFLWKVGYAGFFLGRDERAEGIGIQESDENKKEAWDERPVKKTRQK